MFLALLFAFFVIHTLRYMLHYCMIVYSPFYFQNFSFWVYTNGIHNSCTLHHLGILHFAGIQHTGTCCPDIRYFNTRYMLHITQNLTYYHWINITWMVLRGILVSLHLITA